MLELRSRDFERIWPDTNHHQKNPLRGSPFWYRWYLVYRFGSKRLYGSHDETFINLRFPPRSNKEIEVFTCKKSNEDLQSSSQYLPIDVFKIEILAETSPPVLALLMSHLQPPKRKRSPIVRQACDLCRIRKMRCDAGLPSFGRQRPAKDIKCSKCDSIGLTCTFDMPVRKRGPTSR
jgi:hypothetical protein